VVVAVAVELLGPVALWKSSKSSSAAADEATPFPFEGGEVTEADDT
jgi:hypothetical protein